MVPSTQILLQIDKYIRHLPKLIITILAGILLHLLANICELSHMACFFDYVGYLRAGENKPDTWEATPEQFTKASRGRPFSQCPKLPVSIRLDANTKRR